MVRVKVVVDEDRRVTLPTSVRVGDVFSLEEEPGGTLVLTKVARTSRTQVKLVREGGLEVLSSPCIISWEETRKAMDEFP